MLSLIFRAIPTEARVSALFSDMCRKGHDTNWVDFKTKRNYDLLDEKLNNAKIKDFHHIASETIEILVSFISFLLGRATFISDLLIHIFQHHRLSFEQGLCVHEPFDAIWREPGGSSIAFVTRKTHQP